MSRVETEHHDDGSKSNDFQRGGEDAEVPGEPDGIEDLTVLEERMRAIELSHSEAPRNSTAKVELALELSHLLVQRSRIRDNSDDIDAAIELLNDANSKPAEGNTPLYEAIALILSSCLTSRFHQKGDISDLDAAILVLQNVAEDDLRPQATGSSHKGHTKFTRILRLSRPQQTYEKAVIMNTPPSKRLPILRQLASLLHSRYECTGSTKDLEQARTILQEVVDTTPKEDTGYVNDQVMLGVILRNLANSTEELQTAISVTEQAIGLTNEDDTHLSGYLSNLAMLYKSLYQRTSLAKDLDESIRLTERSLALYDDKDDKIKGDHAGTLENLAILLVLKHEKTGDLIFLDRAILKTKESLKMAPDSYPHKSLIYSNLANRLFVKATKTNRLSIMRRASAAASIAITQTPKRHPDRSRRIRIFLYMLLTHYKGFISQTSSSGEPPIFDVPETFQEIVNTLRTEIQTISSSPGNSIDLAEKFDELAKTHIKGGLHEKPDSLALGLEYARLAVLFTSGPQDHAYYLGNLAERLVTKYRWVGHVEDLRDALKYDEDAIFLVTPHSPTIRIRLLNSYAKHLYEAYQETRAIGFLNDAIRIANQVLAEDPNETFNWTLLRDVIAKSLVLRYLRRKHGPDFAKALEIANAATAGIRLGPGYDAIRASLFETLGWLYVILYHDTREERILERAIQICNIVVAKTPPEHEKWPQRMQQYSKILYEKYGLSGEIGDLNDAIAVARQAWKPTADRGLTSHDDSEAGLILDIIDTDKSMVPVLELVNENETTGYSQDILNRLTLDNEPPLSNITLRLFQNVKHPASTECALHLGTLLVERYARTHDEEDHQRAVALFEDVSKTPEFQLGVSREPLLRARAAFEGAKQLANHSEYDRALECADKAIEVLGEIRMPLLTVKDQQAILRHLAGLPSYAAALTLEVEKSASKALGALELARGRTIGLAIDVRSDIMALKETQPILVEHYESICCRLRDNSHDAPLRVTPQLIDGVLRCHLFSGTVLSLYQAETIESTLRGIRSLQGYENFLLPLTVPEIVALASDGPVVTFNISAFRSDALIVTSNGVRSLMLPRLTMDDFQSNIKLLSGEDAIYKGSISNEGERNELLRGVLLWLWEVAVFPVLDSLGLMDTVPGPDNLPRIWWLNNGAMSLAPLHAAGDHSPGSTSNTMSYVISSYTSTLKALSFARKRPFENPRSDEARMLIVSMPETPGMSPLPNAAEEVAAITRRGRFYESSRLSKDSSPNVTVLSSPSKDDVVKQLPQSDIVHFICHGQSDPQDPSESYLVLGGPPGSNAKPLSSDELATAATNLVRRPQNASPPPPTAENTNDKPTAAHLTVDEIALLVPSNARIAYLSACSTAENSAPDLQDEALHIVSGFQMIGFPHVVGTLWPADDEAAAAVAGKFYEYLYPERTEKDENKGQTGMEQRQRDHWKVAHALHRAVKDYMSSDNGWGSTWDCPNSWAPFVHFGA